VATRRSASRSETAEAFGKRTWGVLFVLCGALFLDALDVSMMGVALPSIRADLGMSTSSLQWVVSAYVLGYGGFLLLGGRAADLFGRRRMFLFSLAVFLVASGLGGLALDPAMLIGARFITGVSAAFTAPAGLSIITTSFAEGPVRNKALAIYTATGASGFSLGLVIGGALTEIGWRWTFLVPVVVALGTLAAAIRLVPGDAASPPGSGSFDLAGAVAVTAGMLLLVFALVEAPGAGWGSGRTVASFAGAGALLAAFWLIERSTAFPLVRLGILRSSSLVRANLGAMSLFGAWVGFLFIATLYLQELRGWSSLATGLAIFPSGVVVVALAPRVAPLVGRFGTTRMISAGLLSSVGAYALLLRIGLHSGYAAAVLPTVVLGGLGFALAYGPLNMAATNGVAPAEQGLAGGLLSSSFQFGGAVVLALVTAVNSAAMGSDGSPQALLDGFHAGIGVSLSVAAAGVLVTVLRLPSRALPASKPA
jgi:MFS family permease